MQFAVVLAVVFNFFILDMTFLVPEEWIINLRSHCKTYPENHTLQYFSLVLVGLTFVAYSAYLGILFH